jgi:hypothetical protein
MVISDVIGSRSQRPLLAAEQASDVEHVFEKAAKVQRETALAHFR